MKFTRLALFASAALVLCIAVRADDGDNSDSGDDQKQQKAPTEIPDFNNLDEYIYVPKSTVNFGFRYISGVKARFSGSGTIAAPESIPSEVPNVSRTYHDGTVEPDGRTVTDDIGEGTGTNAPTGTAPIANDNQTNTWSYDNASQVVNNNEVNMNIYSAVTDNPGPIDQTGKGNVGMEITNTHDFRKFGKHWELKLFGGVSLSDIQAATFSGVNATLITYTDTYVASTGLANIPAPYTSPSTGTDGNGKSFDSSTLLGNAPVASGFTTTTSANVVTDDFKLHGAYATFRFGPQLIYSPNDRLHLLFSVGPALLMSGSTYTVTEVFAPPTGAQIINTVQNTTNRLLPGFYVDATLQYDLSDRSGLYLGLFAQDAEGYTQTASVATQGVITTDIAAGEGEFGGTEGAGTYSTKVDFTDQSGFRAGVAYKF